MVDLISIHALREEGDPLPALPPARPLISIHALREEGDVLADLFPVVVIPFLSTPSARRATASIQPSRPPGS